MSECTECGFRTSSRKAMKDHCRTHEVCTAGDFQEHLTLLISRIFKGKYGKYNRYFRVHRACHGPVRSATTGARTKQRLRFT